MPVATTLSSLVDDAGRQTGVTNRSNYNDIKVLAAATAKSITVPAGAKAVKMTCSANFYLKLTGTAAVPSADVVDGSADTYYNPSILNVSGITTMSAISTPGGVLILEWFK